MFCAEKKPTCYPRVAVQNYNGIALSGFGQGSKYAFLDAAYPNIECYGTKFYYQTPMVTNNTDMASITFIVKYNMTTLTHGLSAPLCTLDPKKLPPPTFS